MYDKENIFAKIIKGEINCDKIYEDEHVLAFNDINPSAKIHVLVIPKVEVESFSDFINKSNESEIYAFFSKVKYIAEEVLSMDEGYRIITNNGENANQTVKHFHVHILGGEILKGF